METHELQDAHIHLVFMTYEFGHKEYTHNLSFMVMRNPCDFKRKFIKLVGDIDYNITNASGQRFCIVFNEGHRDAIIDAFNSLVNDHMIEYTMLEYVPNGDVKNDGKTIITLSSDAVYNKDVNYVSIVYENIDSEIIKKLGFEIIKDDLVPKSNKFAKVMAGFSDERWYRIYHASMSDVFPLKCKFPSMKTIKLNVIEYEGIIPQKIVKINQ